MISYSGETRLGAALCALLLLFTSGTAASPQNETSAFAADLSEIIPAPMSDVERAVAAFRDCAPADHVVLTSEATAFAAYETLASTKALLTNFSRRLAVAALEAAGCDGLADLWERQDPTVRTTADPGLALTEADIAAAVALAKLAGEEHTSASGRVLDYWDSLDPTTQPFHLVFLTRLDAWAPAVTAAREQLDTADPTRSYQVIEADVIPSGEGLETILGTSEIIEWIGGATFRTDQNLSPYENVVDVALAGGFGGAAFAELVRTYRTAIGTMAAIAGRRRPFRCCSI